MKRHEIKKCVWVSGEHKIALYPDKNKPIVTNDVEEFRSKMIGNADRLLLTYTTYES